MVEEPSQPSAPRWTNRGAALTTVSNAAGVNTEVRPLALAWNRPAGAGSDVTYQVLWDFGWGGVNFWPAQDIDAIAMAFTADLTFVHSVLDEKTTVQYKIRAKNSCGYTDSEILVVRCDEETN
jgi:hypothetical protein